MVGYAQLRGSIRSDAIPRGLLRQRRHCLPAGGERHRAHRPRPGGRRNPLRGQPRGPGLPEGPDPGPNPPRNDRRGPPGTGRLHEQARRELEVCQGYVDQLGLDMQLVDVEHLFGGERIVVYYLAEKPRRLPRTGQAAGRRVPDPHRDAADRRPRRGQAAGRLRRLRQAGLLQHPPGRRCRPSP